MALRQFAISLSGSGGGGGSGTVTSVGLTVPPFLSVTGSPITTSGTFAVSLASGTTVGESLTFDGTNAIWSYTFLDDAFTASINWNNRFLLDGSSNLSIDWANRIAQDNTSVTSIDWNNRYLIDDDGSTVILDWSQAIGFDLKTVESIDWNNRLLYSGTSHSIMNWTSSVGVAFTGFSNNASTVPYLDSSSRLVSSTVTPTTLGFLDATSSIQTQLNGKMANPMTTLGDIIYENSTPAPARLAGTTSATKQFLTQTGTGSVSAAPAWGAIAAGDVPSLTATYATVTLNNLGTTAVNADILSGADNSHNIGGSNVSRFANMQAGTKITAGWNTAASGKTGVSLNTSFGNGNPGIQWLNGLAGIQMDYDGTYLAYYNSGSGGHGLKMGTSNYIFQDSATNNVEATLDTTGLLMGTNLPITLQGTGSLKLATTQTTLTGSAGTALCNQPFQGALYKKVAIFLNGFTDTSTQTYTFATAFTNTPYIYGLTAGVTGATVTASTIKFTVTTLTGFVFLEGY